MEDLPFLDLRPGYAELREEMDAAYRRVADSGWYALGAELEEFEAEFARYCGTEHCVGVGCGLDSLVFILRALGLGPGDEVIVPAHTFIATWIAVSAVGARPVPVEPDERTFNLDPAAVQAAIGPRTAAIMPVHLYGQPADLDAIAAIAARHHLPVIEDASQAHGARYRGRRVGALSVAAGFSLNPVKNLGALGSAGAVVTSDAALAGKIRLLRNYGMRIKYQHELPGANSLLDDLQAAFLRVKLSRSTSGIPAAGRWPPGTPASWPESRICGCPRCRTGPSRSGTSSSSATRTGPPSSATWKPPASGR